MCFACNLYSSLLWLVDAYQLNHISLYIKFERDSNVIVSKIIRCAIYFFHFLCLQIKCYGFYVSNGPTTCLFSLIIPTFIICDIFYPEFSAPIVHFRTMFMKVIIITEGTFDVELLRSMLADNYIINYLSEVLVKDRISLQTRNKIWSSDLQALEILVSNDSIDGYLLEVELSLADNGPLTLIFSISNFRILNSADSSLNEEQFRLFCAFW